MQRCFCVVHNGVALVREERPVPRPTGRQVLVKITASGVCHSDLHIWEGQYDMGGGRTIQMKDRGMKLPLVMGHEIAGVVAAVGPDADASRVGEPVVVFPWLGCGECAQCRRGDENTCRKASRALGVFQDGGYADHVLVPDLRYCIDITGLNPAEIAPLACSGVTTYSALRKFGEALKDEPVVIMGAGGLGHMALQMVQALGSPGAIVVDIDPAKRAAALEAGALTVIDGSAPDAVAQLQEATGGGARMVLDLVGAESTLNLAIAAATRGTEVVVVGLFGGELRIGIPMFPLRALGVRGSYVGSLNDLSDLVDLARSGRLKPVKVDRRPLEEANAALMALKAGQVVGRVVLEP